VAVGSLGNHCLRLRRRLSFDFHLHAIHIRAHCLVLIIVFITGPILILLVRPRPRPRPSPPPSPLIIIAVALTQQRNYLTSLATARTATLIRGLRSLARGARADENCRAEGARAGAGGRREDRRGRRGRGSVFYDRELLLERGDELAGRGKDELAVGILVDGDEDAAGAVANDASLVAETDGEEGGDYSDLFSVRGAIQERDREF
jgi:hypothetical protein